MATQAATPQPHPHSRHEHVIRRALRREAARLHEPQRIVAMAIMIVVLGVLLAIMAARAEIAGSDARAYWAAVRIWLDGGDPYHPTGPFLPYVYSPWMLPLFVPWAMLPWDAAWFVWRGGAILLLLWTIRWAYARRPLSTALVLLAMAAPIGSNLDTGNINLLLAVALFGAQFGHGRAGGLIWGIATWMKWVPAPLWLVLPARARGWGLIVLAVSGLLSLLMLPLTIVQLQALFGFGPRPIRVDFLIFVWAAVPWWWRLEHPSALLSPRAWAGAGRRTIRQVSEWASAVRSAPAPTLRTTAVQARDWAAGIVGLHEAGPPIWRRRRATDRIPGHRESVEIGD
jgi:hypothetical protein